LSTSGVTVNAKRAVVCLDYGAIPDGLLELLQSAGWCPVVCSKGESSRGEVNPGEVRLGLAMLTTPEGAAAACERHERRWRHLEIIAIVEGSLLDQSCVREFIAVHCFDYHTLPLDPQRLLFALGHAEEMARLAGRVLAREPPLDALQSILGESPSISAVRRDIAKIAPVDVPVLITGESGTGKELAARAVHQCSPRREHPFVAVNCVSLPPTLIHAELFGSEKGAYTGAYARRSGQFELAQRGTIFLDEIGELHPELQSLLLRFLEEKKVRRIGGSTDIFVDARVVAATNVDLETAVRQGRFREDLYYRLNVLRVHMPPLRERREDIPLLAEEIFRRFAGDSHHRIRGFSDSAFAAMRSYDWPGNVRELINKVRHGIVMSDGHELTVHDLELSDRTGTRTAVSLEDARREADRQAIAAALRSSGDNVARAAELLEVSRATLYRLMARHGLQPLEPPTPESASSSEQ
jgi:DNA-binding NtrC family response regulator